MDSDSYLLKKGVLEAPYKDDNRYSMEKNNNHVTINLKSVKYYDSGEFVCGMMKGDKFVQDNDTVKVLTVYPGEVKKVELGIKNKDKMYNILSVTANVGDIVHIVCEAMMKAYFKDDIQVKLSITPDQGADFEEIQQNESNNTVNPGTPGPLQKSDLMGVIDLTANVSYVHNGAKVTCKAMNKHDDGYEKSVVEHLKILRMHLSFIFILKKKIEFLYFYR